VRRRRRRPSGEPPPLPHKINASGKWWLILAVCVGGISVLLALSSRSLVNLVVADNAILQRIADIRTAWLTNVMKAIGLLATGPAMQALWLVNLVIMVIWRRWRHLLVWLVTGLLVVDGTEAIAEVIQRPRPVGIDILGPWKGYAMPSCPLPCSPFFWSTRCTPRFQRALLATGANSRWPAWCFSYSFRGYT
jgi:hypothetical protein